MIEAPVQNKLTFVTTDEVYKMQKNKEIVTKKENKEKDELEQNGLSNIQNQN